MTRTLEPAAPLPTPVPCEHPAPIPHHRSGSAPDNPASLPVSTTDPVPSDPTVPDAGPLISDSEDSDHLPPGPPNPVPSPSVPAPPKASGPPPEVVDHRFRGWAPVDDNELVSYKTDQRARPSWKASGPRLHRDPDSCKARWKWLLNPTARPSQSG